MDSGGNLRDTDIPPFIETGENDVQSFYKRVLSHATEYKRGVGYFTAGWFRANAKGMAAFAENGGTAQWITSPHLQESDWKALQHGEAARTDPELRAKLSSAVTDMAASLEEHPRNVIAWMIADGLLDIKLALPTEGLNGDFHDKWGVFTDAAGDKVAFHGSQNDSAQGFENYESLDVFCSWNERDKQRVTAHERRFDTIWTGESPNINVYTLPESLKEEIIQLQTTDRPYTLPTTNGITLREYQQDAVDAWFANDCRGMLEMATGTGKTYTALGAQRQLLSQHSTPILTVVAVPYTHLATQWAESLADFGITEPKYIYGTANPNWKGDLSRLLSDMQIGVREDTTIITTHTTFGSEFFREKMRQPGVPVLLIADEVHGLGSEHRRSALLEGYQFRLGLSATPTRYYDDDGTEALEEYFEGIVYEFGLSDAIPEYLTEYEYHPHLVEMTDEELESYAGLSRKLASEMGDDDPDQELIERLLIKRSRIIKGAENKLIVLNQIVQQLQAADATDHLLVYTDPKQIDQAQEELNSLGVIQHRFTNEEDDEERQTLLEGFAEGRWDALVAMKCLDEGVDVPSTQRAILMSNSQNPKQFIQRRGRVLRQTNAVEKEYAEIHDMIVVPTLSPSRDIIESEKNILKRELRRFEEFADDARNTVQARNQIQKLRTEYEI